MRIGKIYFGPDVFQFGLELCLKVSGYSAELVDKYTARHMDVLLVSMFWFRDIYLFEKFIRESGLNHYENRPTIIIGGMQATLTPELCAEFCDYVFIGDGEDYLKGIIDQIAENEEPSCKYIYKKGMSKKSQPACCKPTAFSIQKGNLRNTTRIEIARGCKFKCKFCAISKLKPYMEVETEDIIKELNKQIKKGNRLFSLFAPERTLHSGWEKIEAEINRHRVQSVGMDVRLDHLSKINHHKATFGLEGISYRLRKSIRKPFKDDYVIDTIGNFVMRQSHLSMLTIYFIADLPGEDKEDWESLYDLFKRISEKNWSRNVTISPVLNPLSPKPFTDLQDADIHIFRDYQGKWLEFMRNKGEHWGFRVLESPVWGPWVRLLDALVHRGGSHAAKIIKKMPKNLLEKNPKNIDQPYLAKKLLKEIENNGINKSQLLSPKSE